MRADARRNRERLLVAARDVFVEQGADAPLEAVAARAGVGIATLYRRFPDRRLLMDAVVLDALRRVAEEAQLALAAEPDAWRALARYMHRALDVRVGAVIPALLGRVTLEDEEIIRVRDEVTALVQQMIDRARAEGSLRPDVAFGDISLLLIRLARPLPDPIPLALGDALAHRHLDLLLDGLRADGNAFPNPLPEPALTLADLRGLASASDSS